MLVQILEPEAFPQPGLDRLCQHHDVVLGGSCDKPDRVEAVFVRLASRLGAGFHKGYPALRWIVSPTTGLNHIDTSYFEQAGVQIISLRGRTEFLDRIRATAEHTLALALALIRRLPASVAAVRGGRWDRYPHKGTELSGKTVVIWGYGRIGRQVDTLYSAFGCKVLAHDVIPDRVPQGRRCAFPEALQRADVLSLHLPMHDDTAGIVSSDIIGLLPAHAILINTARGELVDQGALFRALSEHRLAGAALDVLHGEPDPLDPTTRNQIDQLGDRILVTPHIGGFTHESLEAVELFMVDVFLEQVDAAR